MGGKWVSRGNSNANYIVSAREEPQRIKEKIYIRIGLLTLRYFVIFFDYFLLFFLFSI